MHDWLLGVWYGNRSGRLVLLPLSWLFRLVTALRRFLYRIGLLRTVTLNVPVIVVGNIAVGGTGKTPLVVWLVNRLKEEGYKPGVVSRGYGGSGAGKSRLVRPDGDPATDGDEPVLIARRTFCPVVVDSDRVRGARSLLEHDVDVIVSDDGLQHYRLGRSVEIVMMDGARGMGNGSCLPAGPLREPASRIRKTHCVVLTGKPATALPDVVSGHAHTVMTLAPRRAVPLTGGAPQPLEDFAGMRVRAVAGIGNPERFFDMLRKHGLDPIPKPLPDHARLTKADIVFNDDRPVLMTEKDAVKCTDIAELHHYYVPVYAELANPDTVLKPVLAQLSQIR